MTDFPLRTWLNNQPHGTRTEAVTRVARAAEVEPVTFYKWLNEKRVPAEQVAKVSEATGVPRHLIRPDLHLDPEATP